MRKVLLLGAVALGVGACDPEIAKDEPRPAEDSVVAQFDPTASPAIVPSPNDLALDSTTGLVNAPVNPAAPQAEQEFTRDYLNTLNGFPTSAIANTLVEDLDPSTVNANTVKFIDVYAGTILAKPATPTIAYNEDTNRINIIPPQPQGWPKGGRYAVAIIGGQNGVKTTKGKPVIASATWAFASSTVPLVTCQDLTAPDCRTTTELIPSTKSDPAERLADQTASALRLEQLRRGYAPLLDLVSNQFSVPREDIVLLWTFTIMDQPEATFDPAASIVPFPNDLLRLPASGTTPAHLNLPVPPEPTPVTPVPPNDPGFPAYAAYLGAVQSRNLVLGLNTLDGWSTTAPIVSENSPTRGPIDTGSLLDTNTVRLGQTVHFIKVTNPGTGTQPKVKVCFNCTSSLRPDGTPQTSPQQLQIVPEVPLDEATQYAVVMTRGMKDQRGRFVAPTAPQALLRISAPLVDANGKSTVAAVPDANARALEPIRAALKPLFDGLQAAGIQRKDVNLAWAFTTQSVRSVAERLNAAPNNVPADPLFLLNRTSEFVQAMQQIGLDTDTTGHGFIGTYLSPNLTDPVLGVLDPTKARLNHIPFIMFVPKGQEPAGGFPMVVFGHGLTGNRTNILGVVNKLNGAGYAVVAIDSFLHGERSTCAGISPTNPASTPDPNAPFTSPDQACLTGSTCELNPASASYGRCVNAAAAIACDPRPNAEIPGDLTCLGANQGYCMENGRCEGSDFRRVTASNLPAMNAWNFLNLNNLFATRDNFRHHVVDFAQLARMVATDTLNTRLKAQSVENDPERYVGTVNASTVQYLGQSLGGFSGAMSGSVNTRVNRTVINVASGDLVGVLLTATNPTFVARRTGLINNLTASGRPLGTPAFDEFITLARTILDPADPRNYIRFVENLPGAPATREAFIQYIKGDDVIPNPLTEDLISAANYSTQRTVQSYMFDIPVLPVAARHGFLSVPQIPETIRDTAQAQVLQFFATGTAPTP